MKLFASERESVDVAYAGDVVGLANPGTFAIGDTLCEAATFAFDADPAVRAGALRAGPQYRHVGTTSRSGKASRNCARRAPSRYSTPATRPAHEPILAAVGDLQFEVAKYRLEAEYNVKTELIGLPFTLALRVVGDQAALDAATWPSNAKLVQDGEGRPIALFESDWSMRLAQEWNAALPFRPFGELDAVEEKR